MFTLGNWIVFGVLMLVGVVVTIFIGAACDSATEWIITGLVSIIAIGVIMAVTGWYNTNTAAGKRAVKDFKSNVNNGIESNHEDNYIKFDDERGKRYIIYYGIQDTITIIEK